MGWLDDLRGRAVGIDTAPFIYFIEENPRNLEIVNPFFESLDRGDFSGITSTVTLLEVLTHPYRQQSSQLVQQYKDILLSSEHLVTLPLSADIAERAAWLRADRNVSTPDAIQLATALYAKAVFFLTNDARLPSMRNLRLLTLDNLKEEIRR